MALTSKLPSSNEKKKTCYHVIETNKKTDMTLIQDAVKTFELPELDTVDLLLKEAEHSYQELKEQCDNLDTVFAEYDSTYEQSPSVQNNQHQ